MSHEALPQFDVVTAADYFAKYKDEVSFVRNHSAETRESREILKLLGEELLDNHGVRSEERREEYGVFSDVKTPVVNLGNQRGEAFIVGHLREWNDGRRDYFAPYFELHKDGEQILFYGFGEPYESFDPSRNYVDPRRWTSHVQAALGILTEMKAQLDAQVVSQATPSVI